MANLALDLSVPNFGIQECESRHRSSHCTCASTAHIQIFQSFICSIEASQVKLCRRSSVLQERIAVRPAHSAVWLLDNFGHGACALRLMIVVCQYIML